MSILDIINSQLEEKINPPVDEDDFFNSEFKSTKILQINKATLIQGIFLKKMKIQKYYQMENIL